MTDLEKKALRLLEFAASKQFMIYIVRDLLEEISGLPMTDARNFEVREEFIQIDGGKVIDAWIKVLKAIIPIIADPLPGEEYQVVRSTESANEVSKRVKGIVAGAEILHNNFIELRSLLRKT